MSDPSNWDDLPLDPKAQRDAIFEREFAKAKERFDAGVSVTAIRNHYATVGAVFSPITLRRKWDAKVKEMQVK